MLFRLIEAGCGLCCDVKCGNSEGGAKWPRQTAHDLRGRTREEAGTERERVRRGVTVLSRYKSSTVHCVSLPQHHPDCGVGRLSRRDVRCTQTGDIHDSQHGPKL